MEKDNLEENISHEFWMKAWLPITG